ncbi:hypothetical protein GSY69_00375 [Brevibacterium sp. 5221]|uniref:GNAT family N-acetyltransferase n=1 Tax=Brevibacterium rongguiense TaxID=2695267 RepID=A0A6N9H4C8_9MICO|nr:MULTISPECIES: hypothetical protein [Brevibacterium]MYM18474.1 hypothetical protein [Brevibacterium rongguiense]WAL41526.1 hypothetical protein BRM1_06735 [Brevibacterium sp. BRM-1]
MTRADAAAQPVTLPPGMRLLRTADCGDPRRPAGRARLAALLDGIAGLDRAQEERLSGLPAAVATGAERLARWLTDTSYTRTGAVIVGPGGRPIAAGLALFSQLENLDFMDSEVIVDPRAAPQRAAAAVGALEAFLTAARERAGRTKDLRFTESGAVPASAFSELALPAVHRTGPVWWSPGLRGSGPSEPGGRAAGPAGPRDPAARAVRPGSGAGALGADATTARMLALGYRLIQVERRSLLALAAVSAPEAPAGLTARSWAGLPGDGDMAALLELLTTFSADVPAGDGSFEHEAVSADRLRNDLDVVRAQGGERYWTALFDTAGRCTAATAFAAGPRPVAQQEETVTARAHRGRGLAGTVKRLNAAHLRERRPDVAWVQTYNACENDAMLAINNAVGFEPVAFTGLWERS